LGFNGNSITMKTSRRRFLRSLALATAAVKAGPLLKLAPDPKWTLNPEWVALGPEADVVFVYNSANYIAERCYQFPYSENPCRLQLVGGKWVEL
jgi:hypothetical protein